MEDETVSQIHLPTLAAVSLVAYAIAVLSHEIAGHGGACIALGSVFDATSTVDLVCREEALSPWTIRAIAAAGTLDNLVLAALSFLAIGLLPSGARGNLRAFCWISLMLNGLSGGGYLMTSPLFGFGDWTSFVDGLAPLLAWKLALTAAGVGISLCVLRGGRGALEPFVGTGPARMRRTWTMALVPYASAVVLGTAGAALNPRGLFLMGLMSSALGLCWMIWLPQWLRRAVPSDEKSRVTLGVEPSRAWMAAGGLAALVFIALFGPGVPRGR